MTVRILSVLLLAISATTVTADETYAIYFVRHAEKELSNPAEKDPTLTRCGEERAARLAVMFEDIDLQAVYSTDFKRTQSTAMPTALSKNIPVTSYDPFQPDVVLGRLMDDKQNALVVGHSNTTSQLAGTMAGLELELIDETEFDRLYLVVATDGAVHLQLLHQAFRCSS